LHSRWKTPTNSILCTSGLLIAMIALASAGVHTQEAFQLLSNASLTHYEVAYLAMFAIPLVGATTLRRTLPWWLKWTSIVGVCATVFSLLISAYPYVSVVNPVSYAVKIIGTLLVSNSVAFAFYRMRTRSTDVPVLAERAVSETEG
ncbi:MAG TPA: amino acid permease, partial [Terracidiphilus sp.]